MLGANDWFTWAILSAVFAAMTAIFAKVGLQGVDSDYATVGVMLDGAAIFAIG